MFGDLTHCGRRAKSPKLWAPKPGAMDPPPERPILASHALLIHRSAWKGYSANFVLGVWPVRSRIGIRYRARRPVSPSWAAGLFRAPLRPRAGCNGPKVAWTEPRAPETMRNGGGPAELGGSAGPTARSGYEVARGGRMTSKMGTKRTVYRIVARSELGERYACAFEGMRMETRE